MIYLFTHTDLDGMGCAVLATLHARMKNEEIRIEYCGYNTINRNVIQLLDNVRPGRRDRIYITDLSVDARTAARLDRQPCPCRVLDHHPPKPGSQSYPWMNIQIREDVCGTSLVYDELLREELGDTGPAADFSRDVCLWDTWRFDKEIISRSEILNTLHDLIGHDAFLDMAVDDLSAGRPLEIPYYLERAAQGYIENRNAVFESKERNMIRTVFEGCETGVVFADDNASSLAEYVFQRHPELDIVAVIYLPSGISLRTRREDVDLTQICHARGGGGHQKASAFRLEADQARQVVEMLLG